MLTDLRAAGAQQTGMKLTTGRQQQWLWGAHPGQSSLTHRHTQAALLPPQGAGGGRRAEPAFKLRAPPTPTDERSHVHMRVSARGVRGEVQPPSSSPVPRALCWGHRPHPESVPVCFQDSVHFALVKSPSETSRPGTATSEAQHLREARPPDPTCLREEVAAAGR